MPSVTIELRELSDILACRTHASRLAGAASREGQRFAAAVTELACAAIGLSGGARISLTCCSTKAIARIEGSGAECLPAALQQDVTDSVRLEVDKGVVILMADRSAGTGGQGASERSAPHPSAFRPSVPDPIAELASISRRLWSVQEADIAQREELLRLNAELEDTNRGVLALYAELDDRAEQLRAAAELKTRFLSNVSHEFRTPLNSILALCRLLLDRADGPLLEEQEKQVSYILSSARNLTELVNDLLDLAKAEAGRLDVRPRVFALPDLFGSLRAVMRPLRVFDAVELIFEEPPAEPEMFSDDAKVSQIMRNLISNALKFTERGEVRVRGRFLNDVCMLTVSDTGIGIGAEDHERVFEEFTQIPNPMQGRAKGTGLGLSLSRRLASLLGGSLTVVSELAAGSTFTLALPRLFRQEAPAHPEEPVDALGVFSAEGEQVSRRDTLSGTVKDEKEGAG